MTASDAPLKILRDVTGLSPAQAALSGPALVMVDLRNTYRDGLMRLEGVEPALLEARTLLARARDAVVAPGAADIRA